MNDSEFAREAFKEIFGKNSNYRFYVEYGRLHDYNAQVVKVYNNIKFKMSNKWLNVSPMIKKGLFESLLASLFKHSKVFRARRTMSLEIYNNFIKNLDLSSEIRSKDPLLFESFKRVNKAYFNNSLDVPNLRFGRAAFSKLASYNFHTDTVTVSSIFKDSPQDILDLLMYHELLHKKLKFSGVISKQFHTRKFRDFERQFKNYDLVDKEMNKFVRKKQVQLSRKNFNLKRFFRG